MYKTLEELGNVGLYFEDYFNLEAQIKELTEKKNEIKKLIFSELNGYQLVDIKNQKIIKVDTVKTIKKCWKEEELKEFLNDRVKDFQTEKEVITQTIRRVKI